jgi:hypothetical protein
MDTKEGLPKIGVGDMVSINHHFNCEFFVFNGEVREVKNNERGNPVLVVCNGDQTKEFDLESTWVSHVTLMRKAGIEQFAPPPLDDDFADRIARKVHTPSYYTVSFGLTLQDVPFVTISGRRNGKITPAELIRLAVLQNYRKLSYFDGTWLSVASPLKKILEYYVKDGIPRIIDGFGVDCIEVSGYDAKTGEFYEVPIPPLNVMLIYNLDAAYELYVKQWVVRSSDVQD